MKNLQDFTFFRMFFLRVVLMGSHLNRKENSSYEGSSESYESSIPAGPTKNQPSEDANELKTTVEKETRIEKPPVVGHFALVSSQQPAGFFAFGGNVPR